jgi:hypothetical protein
MLSCSPVFLEHVNNIPDPFVDLLIQFADLLQFLHGRALSLIPLEAPIHLPYPYRTPPAPLPLSRRSLQFVPHCGLLVRSVIGLLACCRLA